MCVYDRVVEALNAKKEKYLNYETSANDNTIGYVCVHCHDSKELNFFGVSRKFKCYKDGYARVTSPDKLVLKENTNLKLLVDDQDQLLAIGNTLKLDKSYHPSPTITIQLKLKRRQVYPHNIIIQQILSRCQNCNICKMMW